MAKGDRFEVGDRVIIHVPYGLIRKGQVVGVTSPNLWLVRLAGSHGEYNLNDRELDHEDAVTKLGRLASDSSS